MRYANECMSEFFCLPNSNPLRFDVLFFKRSGVKKSKSICNHKIVQSLNIYFEAAFFYYEVMFLLYIYTLILTYILLKVINLNTIMEIIGK